MFYTLKPELWRQDSFIHDAFVYPEDAALLHVHHVVQPEFFCRLQHYLNFRWKTGKLLSSPFEFAHEEVYFIEDTVLKEVGLCKEAEPAVLGNILEVRLPFWLRTEFPVWYKVVTDQGLAFNSNN